MNQLDTTIGLDAPRDLLSQKSAALLRWIRTDADPASAAARLVLAAVMFPHGAQHLVGWFGGYGYRGTHGWLTATLGVPGPVATLAIVVEFLAPLALLVGAGGRFAAIALGGFLAVAASTHADNGFFMNWLGKQGGEGFEYHLLAIALAVVVAIRGSGAVSVDRVLARRSDARKIKGQATTGRNSQASSA
jgi:putative oxidoreductase